MLLSQWEKLSASRLYFNPRTYPPPINDDVMKGGERGTSCTSWFALKRDIEIAAYDMGNPIISNGSTLSGKSNDGSRSRNNWRFICGTLGKTFKKSVAMPITKSMQYRETSLIKNRKN